MAYKGALMVNDDEMFASFRRLGELGGIALVHAENGDVVAELSAKLLREGNRGPEAHAYSRPPQVEGEAAQRAIAIANVLGAPVYIVHVSTEQATQAIARARAAGHRVFGEVLAQQLVIDESVYRHADWQTAAAYVMSPPFRAKHHQDALWAGLTSGNLQTTATDHCCFCAPQKAAGRDNFTKIPNGTGGLEDRLPVLWTKGVRTGRITMNEFVAVTSTNIAQILNIYPQKGAILPGADADIVIWDPRSTTTIGMAEPGRKHHMNMDYSAWEGWVIDGKVDTVLSRGAVVVEHDEYVGSKGHGRFVRRGLSQYLV
jgi:dihydropyrimidinase